MKNTKCFAALNEIELDLANEEGLLEIVSYVLQGIDTSVGSAVGNAEKALWFASRCETFSKMLFAALNGLQDTHKKIASNLSCAQDACIKPDGGDF